MRCFFQVDFIKVIKLFAAFKLVLLSFQLKLINYKSGKNV